MEQKLEDKNNKISVLKKSKNLLKKGLKKQEKINELKIKENKVRPFAPADIDKETDEKNEYLNINLSDINNLFDTVKKNIETKIVL